MIRATVPVCGSTILESLIPFLNTNIPRVSCPSLLGVRITTYILEFCDVYLLGVNSALSEK
jgi:hypothetical protein